ncbi:unnamed protein product, partial [Dicrocoelium dendriticum]
MLLGLKTVSQTFQRFIDQVFVAYRFCLCLSRRHLDSELLTRGALAPRSNAFDRLFQHGITINAEKCSFGVGSVSFLGYHISPAGVVLLQDKIKAIIDYPEPHSFKQLRRSDGAAKFYRRFIPSCASLMQPLMDLLREE